MKKESVWNYPRPPRLEPTARRLRVFFAGEKIADTTRALRVLETSHPPTYYIPVEDIKMQYLQPSTHWSFCEFKGEAAYWTVQVGKRSSPNAAWSYPNPTPRYADLKNHIAFYASRVDECYVDDERVIPQAGDFYGGWITSDLIGPFKGGRDTWGW
ncbi:MAG: DUF427 domain-containing protein [Chloroherpetonaceae bacterium]|nr:DUF427 domain-containing protein [Chloroherpetonaceae bacterium]MCS7210826.1 DUF427 domain-containing protein [Chloroherpetonaceae bacterium]MDW8020493.1 DUF427 domain-containing protein [Chloroherpetonaceae bacterium]MDW8465365.1 DUF427 domain-containing protein [Chloroherpetonaceae bacterium]